MSEAHAAHARDDNARAPDKRPLSIGALFGVWVALLALLAISWGSAYVPMGAWNSVINLAVAVTKASLVMLFFMRLRSAGGLARLIAAAGFFGLALLIGLSLVDALSR